MLKLKNHKDYNAPYPFLLKLPQEEEHLKKIP